MAMLKGASFFVVGRTHERRDAFTKKICRFIMININKKLAEAGNSHTVRLDKLTGLATL